MTPDRSALKRRTSRKSAAQVGIASANKEYDDGDAMHWPMCSGVCKSDGDRPVLQCIKAHRGPGCCYYYDPAAPYQVCLGGWVGQCVPPGVPQVAVLTRLPVLLCHNTPPQAETAMAETVAVRGGNYAKSDDSDYEDGGYSHKKTLVCW
jgi:hypothetical protein